MNITVRELGGTILLVAAKCISFPIFTCLIMETRTTCDFFVFLFFANFIQITLYHFYIIFRDVAVCLLQLLVEGVFMSWSLTSVGLYMFMIVMLWNLSFILSLQILPSTAWKSMLLDFNSPTMDATPKLLLPLSFPLYNIVCVFVSLIPNAFPIHQVSWMAVTWILYFLSCFVYRGK